MIGRPIASDDRGLTLVELLIAMSLLLVALVMFGSALFAVQTAGARGDQLGRAADSAYQALTEMDRQLRSGYIASETRFTGADANVVDMVRIYTEAYAPPAGTTSPNTVARCVAWAVVNMVSGKQGLYTVWWTPTPTGSKPTFNASTRTFTVPTNSGVTNVAGTRLVTDELTGASASTFSVPSISGDLGQRLVVTFQLREATDKALTSPQAGSPSPWINTVSTTITPRNSPRSSMNADTSVYTSARSGLCG